MKINDDTEESLIEYDGRKKMQMFEGVGLPRTLSPKQEKKEPQSEELDSEDLTLRSKNVGVMNPLGSSESISSN